MAKSAKSLVIVESPSKAKTIGKYLGPDYQVKACMGHLRDLPKSTIGIDFEHDYEPLYQPIADKAEIISELKKDAAAASSVFLATDPDREGEAIAWHLRYLLDLPAGKSTRVTFNEITKKVVTESIAAPRDIDANLVDAQQARRVLDRIVGYQLSPLLWKKIRRGLSAGRVQSVATRLVVDREEEIRAFESQEYWTLEGMFQRTAQPGAFRAKYFGGKKKQELNSEQDADAVLNAVSGKPFTVTSVKQTDRKKAPAPPFITSTLQQEASRKLNMTPRRTMTIAQQLYEGVDIEGEGTLGLITYMRTDSLRLSEEALQAAGEFITARYGKSYYAGKRTYKSNNNAQDAHEAIRPSAVRLDPETVRTSLTGEQYRLYKLIWSRFLASQMADAVYNAVAIDLECEGHVFRANHQSVKFAGHTAVYEEGRDEESEEKAMPLPDLKEGETVRAESFDKQQHFTQPPSRYTEAMLVRAMEEKGVGRPSTYASIISTIEARNYVTKKEKRLYPTPLGEVVNGMLKEYFKDIIDVEFTAGMESRLDAVEAGNIPWKQVIRDFDADFEKELADATEALKDKRLKVPVIETEEICDVCGRKMVIKNGRFGDFLACPGFPECTFTKPIVERMPGSCPKCGGAMLKRKSKKGYTYYACEEYQECGFMSWDVPTAEICPKCGKTLFKRAGRGRLTPFCINEACERFLPEDKRGYKRKTAAATDAAQTETKPETGKPAAKSAAKPSKTGKATAAKTAGKQTARKPTKKTAGKAAKKAAKTTTKTTTKTTGKEAR